jgi:hypothetical protein
MPGHGKWRISDSLDYLSSLGNFAARDFLVPSQLSVFFMRIFDLSFVDDLNFFRIFSQSDLFLLW